MRISHTHKFVYINVPFVGCDFMMRELDKYSQIFGDENMNSEFYCHVKVEQLKDLFAKKGWNWDEYYKLAVVRNPLDRIVYRHESLQNCKPKDERIQFDERIQYQLDWVNQQHWWTHSSNGEFLLDGLIHYEKIQTGFNFVCDKLKLKKVKLNLPKKYNQFNYQDYYSDEVAKKCEEHHKTDIKYFNFPKIIEAPTIIRKTENKTLPHFLIPGFQKCGTSSLWVNLKKHPELNTSTVKEINYFTPPSYILGKLNYNYDKGVDWYKSHFNETGEKWGEASVNYLYDFKQQTLERMYETLPDAKLIIAVRNPITRAYSSYNHYMQNLEKSKNHKGWLRPGKSFYENILEEQKCDFKWGMVKVGFYWDTLKKIYDYYPSEQVLLLKQEDLLAYPDKTYSTIYDFLEVKYVKRKYGFSHRRNYSSGIDKKSFDLLTKLYEDKNFELKENTNIDYTNQEIFCEHR